MLGQRIAQYRKQAGLSQGELAKRLHISSSAVGMYEQGRREPSVEILLALAREFGITVDALLATPAAEVLDRTGSTPAILQNAMLQKLSREELLVLFLSSILGY